MLNLMRRFGWLVPMLAILSAPSALVGQTPLEFERSPLVIEGGAGRHEFEVELAVTPEQRQRGLMFRSELGDDEGMLFDFEKMQPLTFWMRNTLISLDMLFIDDQGRIRRIAAETTPLSDVTIPSGEPVQAVLELRGGRAAELGIQPGDRVIHPVFDAGAAASSQ